MPPEEWPESKRRDTISEFNFFNITGRVRQNEILHLMLDSQKYDPIRQAGILKYSYDYS